MMPRDEATPTIRVRLPKIQKTQVLFDTEPGTVIPEHLLGDVGWAFALESTMEDDAGIVSSACVPLLG
jgi:hypothetical protein